MDSEEDWEWAHREALTHPLTEYTQMPELAAKYTDGRRALEVGCGISKMINPFHLKGYDCYGVEQCRFAVKVCHQRFPQYSFIVSRGQHLPFKEKSFDVVYTNTVLQHNFHWRKLWIVQNVRHVLKDDGVFLTQEDTGGGIGMNKRLWMNHPYSLTEKSYEALMLVAGFKFLEKVIINLRTEDCIMSWRKILE